MRGFGSGFGSRIVGSTGVFKGCCFFGFGGDSLNAPCRGCGLGFRV